MATSIPAQRPGAIDAEIVGIRALAAHAKDDAARAFHAHFGFVPSLTDPLHRFLLLNAYDAGVALN